MMKFILIILFMGFMMKKNKMIMFYYNVCYLISFMMMFLYFFKDNLWVSITMSMGVSYYSILLMILTMWIFSLMMMCLSEFNLIKMMMFNLLMLLLFFFFTFMDLLLFYLVFEVSLIPTFFLIIYWGSNPERISAGYYLMMYMLVISFPLLLYIMNMYLWGMTLKFSLMVLVMEYYNFGAWGFMLIYLAFFIKMPIYLFHIWLPKAHVEAPVYGSMILAAILLKMGSYGLIRLMEIYLKSSLKYNYLIYGVAIVGSGVVSVLCLGQIDMKSLVAYSSVVHMNMMLCSLLTFYKLGFLSSYIMMISHGVCSSGLFYLVNVYYSRTLSRLLLLNKGMMRMLPSLSLWWFLLCASNFSFPLSLNFISEILMLGAVLNWEMTLMFYLMLICFFSSGYSLYLFSYVQHGAIFNEKIFIMSLMKELFVLIMHLFPLIFMLLNLLVFM